MATVSEKLAGILSPRIASGDERGVQVAAYHKGKLVVDLAMGVADAATGKAMTSDTLVPAYSTTKGIAATVAHGLVEQGLLAYDMPVAKVWPEFAANGKAGITFRQVLNHSAGMHFMPPAAGYREICDWDWMCQAIAAMPPGFEPGTRFEYHAITYSWLVGEPCRRVTGQTIPQLVQQMVSRPLGTDGIYVGEFALEHHRIALLDETEPPPAPPADAARQSIPVAFSPLSRFMNRDDVRRAVIPASNGMMTARAIAAHYAALLPAGCNGVRLLPPERVAIATELPVLDKPPAAFYPRGHALGYALRPEMAPGLPRAFGHGGYGGSQGLAFPHLELAVGFTRNRFTDPQTTGLVVDALVAAAAAGEF